jgi:hypothetical protein
MLTVSNMPNMNPTRNLTLSTGRGAGLIVIDGRDLDGKPVQPVTANRALALAQVPIDAEAQPVRVEDAPTAVVMAAVAGAEKVRSLGELYEDLVGSVFLTLSRSKVGRLLIDLAIRSNRSLTIRALPGQLQALTGAAPGAPAGGARDTVIRYSPETWWFQDSYPSLNGSPLAPGGPMPSVCSVPIDPGYLVNCDDVLLHEMVHAVRLMRGFWRSGQTMTHFDSVEDFYAVLIANMYLSEIGREVALRSDHNILFHPLRQIAPAVWLDPRAVVRLPVRNRTGPWDDHEYQLDLLRQEMPDLYLGLASVPCRWNPVRAHQQVEREEEEDRRRLYGLTRRPVRTGPFRNGARALG